MCPRGVVTRGQPPAKADCGALERALRRRPQPGALASLVAIDALAPFVTLLRLDREGRDRARFEPLERDRLAGLLAIAVGAVIKAGDRRIDLRDQLALSVARPQFDGTIRFGRRAVGKIGMVFALGLEMRQRLLRLFQDLFLPAEQLVAEILPLALIHERLFVGRSVGLVLVQ